MRKMYRLHLGHRFGSVQCDAEEELQSANRGVQRCRRNTVVDEMQLVVAQFLDTGGVRRAPEVLGKLPYRTKVMVLRLLAQLAHPHVVGHALAQRADARLLSFHGLLLSEIEAGLPHIQHRQLPAVANHLLSKHPATVEHHPYRASGLVQGSNPAFPSREGH